jgi:tetratricopeptide (TPR) repeat protein/tRNA A-37 threonylcarbamoyl transferase component Bud32
MMSDRFQRCEELFHAALALEGAAREAFLEEACATDRGLRAEVERLLSAHARAGDFIGSPAVAPPATWAGAEEWAGRRIGPYSIVRELGRGGMGAVYLAERADGQYQHRVALKLIKRGMDTEQVLTRFRSERQILASLDHPNIARLLDGGSTDQGLPFFAMEYIDGEPIDTYAGRAGLSVEDRLRLFLQVCGAVAYAHQNLVIHRDIKPLNILVTSEGTPKLLDFGIAKVLHPGGEETSTVTSMRLLTPEYASPEQVEGRHATTVSDVYALGVVLYELLTGRSPYRLRSRTPQEVVEAVRTTDPERPSQAGDDEKVRRRLRGDLDTILLTALRKEPARRYQSVEQFGADVRRHLEGMPVLARPDTFGYRAGKFVRRHRVPVAAGSLVVLALVAGTVATAYQAHQARVAQARAERRFADVRKLAHTVLFDYHDAIKDLRGARPVRERLVHDALGYLDGLAREAEDDPTLQRELAAAYRRVGDLQVSDPSGGDTEGASRSYAKALAISEALLRADSSAQARRDVASAALALGSVVWERGNLGEGLAHAQHARALLEPLVAAAPHDTDLRLQLSTATDRLGQISLEQGEISRSLEYHRSDLRQLEAAPEGAKQRPAMRHSISVAYGHLADAQSEAGDFTGALESHRRSLALRQGLAQEFPDNATYADNVATAQYYLATVLGHLGRWNEALTLQRELVARNPKTPFVCRIGEALGHLGRHAEALGYYRLALERHHAELRADTANLLRRLAVAEDDGRVCKTLATLGRPDAPTACGQASQSIAKIVVDSNYAFPRALLASVWTDLGQGYETLAGRRAPPAPERGDYRTAALAMHRRSLEIWTDLQARGVLSPVDTPRVSAAHRAVLRTEGTSRTGE